VGAKAFTHLKEPFPLDGGRAGLGVFAQVTGRKTRLGADAHQGSIVADKALTPIPTLPPSRGKGFFIDFRDV
jgi:hypothetical protein